MITSTTISKLGSLIVAPTLFFSVSLAAAEGQNPTVDSYAKAREVVDAAIEASGGVELLNGIKTVQWRQGGTSWARNQSPKVDPPFQANRQEGRIILDLERGRLLFETGGTLPGRVFHTRTVIAGDEKFVLNINAETVQRNPNLDMAHFEFIHRLFPPLMLRKALQQAHSLRWLGTTEYDGRRHDLVIFAWHNGLTPTLYIDSETHHLSKYEMLFPDNLTGDTLSEVGYPTYREVSGLQVPSGYRQSIGGTLTADIEYTDIAINGSIDPDDFNVPFGFREIARPPTGDVRVVEFADDVYMIEGLAGFGYNFYFVAFDEFIVAYEAAVSRGVSAQAIARMKEAVPDKPIRYLVVSHHHEDHAGGVRAFIDEGATIVTTASNRAYLEEMAESETTLAGGGPAAEMAAPKFEFVDGERVIEDAGHKAIVYDLGPTPHADEILALYLPNEKILIEADLIEIPRSGHALPADDVTVHFAAAVEQLGLEIDHLGGVHGTVGTWVDVEDALRRRAAK